MGWRRALKAWGGFRGCPERLEGGSWKAWGGLCRLGRGWGSPCGLGGVRVKLKSPLPAGKPTLYGSLTRRGLSTEGVPNIAASEGFVVGEITKVPRLGGGPGGLRGLRAAKIPLLRDPELFGVSQLRFGAPLFRTIPAALTRFCFSPFLPQKSILVSCPHENVSTKFLAPFTTFSRIHQKSVSSRHHPAFSRTIRVKLPPKKPKILSMLAWISKTNHFFHN